ncbi:hypothetical protein E1301_Tti021680 [Triplophysa tibetana]|uniref:Uncharacterized protein n=1 Tax=Triplophysa tibetana TaxID=1572043 RepID=A0A5A9N747_9TELE|nr:hypothetical protein E1301_Tti021680 [Triplophysa tibetana]
MSAGAMSFPKYALFYFPESDIVKVDSTDIILGEHRLLEFVVGSRAQLGSEEGCVEVRLSSPIRHGQTKTLAAKILLLSDVYKDLIVKRDAFKREDIWKTTTQQGKKTAEALKIASTSQGAADVAMGDKLKRDLQNLQRKKAVPITSTPMSDDSDNTDIDMFEKNELRRSRKRAAVDSDDEQDGDNGSKEFENSLLQSTPPQNTVKLDGDVVKALKDGQRGESKSDDEMETETVEKEGNVETQATEKHYEEQDDIQQHQQDIPRKPIKFSCSLLVVSPLSSPSVTRVGISFLSALLGLCYFPLDDVRASPDPACLRPSSLHSHGSVWHLD